MKFGPFKKITVSITFILGLVGLSSAANASIYKHVGSQLYMGQTLCVSGSIGSFGSQVNLWNQQSLCQPSPWIVQPDSGGFRLKLQGSNNLCLNAPSSSSFGSLITLYTCTPGDSGQVFEITPNPGQLKFKLIRIPNAPSCIEPEFGPNITNYYNGHKLRVYTCSTSNNQKFLEQ